MTLLLAVSLTSLMQSCATSEEEVDGDMEVSEEFENGEDGNVADEEGNEDDGEYENAEGNSADDEYANENGYGDNGYEDNGAEENGFDEGEYANDAGDNLENLVDGDIEADYSENNLLPQENAGADNLLEASGQEMQANQNAGGNVAVTEDGYEDLSAQPAPPVNNAAVASGPVEASAGVLLPEDGSKMAYIVQPGETLSGISTNIYGQPGMAAEIATLSSMTDRNFVRAGDVVYYQLNDQTRAFAQSYESAPRQELTVQAGDSLSLIAQRIYGSTESWPTIWRQNSDISNPDRIEVGQTIYFVSPQTFATIIDNAKSMRLADLINTTLDTNIETVSADADANQIPTSDTAVSSAFQVTMNLLNHLSS